MDERESAYRKWQALKRMTVAAGCSTAEAATARRLAAALDNKYGFSAKHAPPPPPTDFYTRYARAEARAARRWRWEYRTCGKMRCHCMRGVGGKHGPYKYGKQRKGNKVASIYMGK